MKMNVISRPVRRVMQFSIDAIISVAAMSAAIFARYDFDLPASVSVDFLAIVLAVFILKPSLIYMLGGYRSFWSYTSLREVMAVSAGLAIAALILAAAIAINIFSLAWTVVVIDLAFSLLLFVGVRVTRRIQASFEKRRDGGNQEGRTGKRQILLIGAGDSANTLISQLRTDASSNVVGLLDDDPSKKNMLLRGKPILGQTTDLNRVVKAYAVDQLIIAMPSASRSVIHGLMKQARTKGVQVKVVAPANPGNIPKPSHEITIADLKDSSEVNRSLWPSVVKPANRELITVTGGAGYIGSHLVRLLLDKGHRVRVLDNFTYGDHALRSLYGNPNLEIIEGDISCIRDVVQATKDAKSVIALAAIVGDPACGLNPEETLNLNYESTKVLVETCNFYGVERLVFASSCSVYGASTGEEFLTESSTLTPVSLYARTRILSEQVIFERCGDVVPTIMRLSTVFGFSKRMRFDLVVNTLTVRGIMDHKFQVFGGSQWRPFVHCKDAAQAFFLAAVAPRSEVDHEIFNVGSNNMNYTINQVADVVAKEVGHVEVVNRGEVDDARNYKVHFDKIANKLAFRPEYDLRRGVREMVVAIEADPELQDYRSKVYSNYQFIKDYMISSGMILAD